MDFYKRVEVLGKHIPKGKVSTYGQIALLCGKPNHSRQVGYALKHNKAGVDFPAYRVINGQGFLAGAKAFKTPEMQREMLLLDGIEVSEENRVDLKKYGWKHSLVDAQEFYEMFRQMNI
ncbi:MGMT family protein [Lachnospiraceae bacterium OttesenSCG-928-E19]|nr:MGMT family protein [Lachnospiraceae bacterium OttesenSCG-928-E19]